MGNATSFICHDAGAANQLISLYINAVNDNCIGYFDGPAKELWANSNKYILTAKNIDECIKNSNKTITGTSWMSNLDHIARVKAKQYGAYSITLLDHWSNYRSRFIYNGELILPDELWVVDEYAYMLAREQFGADFKIRLQNDYYLKDQVKAIKSCSRNSETENILYLCEPLLSCWGKEKKGEFQALQYFIDNRSKLGIDTKTPILIKIHPSEVKDKYKTYMANLKEVNIDFTDDDLINCINKATTVVGIQTYALVVALSANKKVISCLPPWGPKQILPHEDILYIKNLK